MQLIFAALLATAAALPLEDTADVAAAKAEFKAAFQAAFDDAAAGGLAAKQAPAPAHVIAAPVATFAAPAVYHAGYPLHTALNAVPFGVHGLGYAAGLHYPYAGLNFAAPYPVLAAAAPAEE